MPYRPIVTAALAIYALALTHAGELIPFTLPWDDDAPGATDLSHLNHSPAGKHGFIKVDENAHFSADGQRLRLYGVNVTAASSFPSHAEAEAIAGRLAKFGFNIVRFHHMDNNWGSGSLIDYSAGNSRSLHADNLDKLDFFVAQLKARGIYTNFNLVNSREFLPADGLDAGIAALDWKERHVLGFVDPHFRSLEKEYATQLLAHENPYTGLSYADDPAIAVVEINNENGIFQQYFEGALDRWPDVYNLQLQTRWNDWLQGRYPDTDALLEAWSGESVPLGAQLIDDPSFQNGTASWNLEQHQGAAASATADTFDGRQGLRIQVTTAGDAGWHVQLNQGGKSLVKDQLYTLRFWAKADAASAFSAAIGQAYDPWGTVHSFSNLQATEEWQEFTFLFRAGVSDNNLRLNFNGFAEQLGALFLSEVTLTEGGDLSATLPEGQSLEARNIASNLRSASYLPNRVLDWTRFLSQVATEYWNDMRDHLKETLGYQGLINGTTIMNTGPNIQAGLDIMDTHAYWQHPVFPGEPWDPNNWTLNAVSMVNTLNNTLAGLARQRVQGYPHTVSEYQHAFPNPFASEGPLLVSAYAAFQDWDGIYYFDYARGQSWDQGYFDNYFNMNAHPSAMANALVGALIFRRGDIAPANSQLLMNFSPEREIEAIATQGQAWNVGDGRQLGIPPEHFATTRVALSIGENAAGSSDDPPPAPAGPAYASDTGQLLWDQSVPDKSVVTLDTPRAKAVIGFIDGRSFTLGETGIQFGATQEDWATLSLTMLHGAFDTPHQPARLLVVATGLTENTDLQWTDESKTSVGSNWGRAPSLVEAIPATLTLPYAPELLQAWALDETGQRGASIPIQSYVSGSALQIGEQEKSLWYEIEIAADPEADPFLTWQEEHFSPEQLEDPEISGAAADPDGDTLPNLMEFLLALDPRSADTRIPLQKRVEFRDKQPVFVYAFDINRAYPTQRLALATAENLENWTTHPLDAGTLSVTLTPKSTTHEQLRIEYAPSAYPAFSRLQLAP